MASIRENTVNGLKYRNQLEVVLSDYGEEINDYRLSTQLQILKTKFVNSSEKSRLCSNKLYAKTTLVYKLISSQIQLFR